MREKYTFTIAGQNLSFISDEDKDFVNTVVETTDDAITNIMLHNTRCAKLDAALICAVEYCSERLKAEKKVKNLEAQISLYEATVARLKKEGDVKGAKKEMTTDELVCALPNKEKEKAKEKAEQVELPDLGDNSKEALRAAKLKEIESLLRK